jgi:phage anti-repressor protein
MRLWPPWGRACSTERWSKTPKATPITLEALAQAPDFSHLIPILWGTQPMVDARALHGALGVGRDFSNWIKDRLDFCDAVEGVGYEVSLFANFGENSPQGRPTTDYRLTVPLAKEIAMIERTGASKGCK